jgi:GH25 family lysozyme M1 (1,4-beta-N-acetylmuramidase)
MPKILKAMLRRFVAPEQDPIVAMLIRELDEASKALEVASSSMKHNRVSPVVITQTRAAYRRAQAIAQNAATIRNIGIPNGERPDVPAS